MEAGKFRTNHSVCPYRSDGEIGMKDDGDGAKMLGVFEDRDRDGMHEYLRANGRSELRKGKNTITHAVLSQTVNKKLTARKPIANVWKFSSKSADRSYGDSNELPA